LLKKRRSYGDTYANSRDDGADPESHDPSMAAGAR
jgi:hypothetical protein